MIDVDLINLLKTVDLLSLCRQHRLALQIMKFVISDEHWALLADVHWHMATSLELKALYENSAMGMRKAGMSYCNAIELAPTRQDILDDYIEYLVAYGKHGDAQLLFNFVKEHLSKRRITKLAKSIRLENECDHSDPNAESNWLRMGVRSTLSEKERMARWKEAIEWKPSDGYLLKAVLLPSSKKRR